MLPGQTDALLVYAYYILTCSLPAARFGIAISVQSADAWNDLATSTVTVSVPSLHLECLTIWMIHKMFLQKTFSKKNIHDEGIDCEVILIYFMNI